ncbi:MAG: HalX domain-containing protein, partial [Halobacteriaceae archaeon]
ERLLNRRSYTDLVDELASLASKRAALEAHKTDAELDDSEKYQQLLDQIKSARDELDDMMSEFQEEDFRAILRDIDSEESL